MYVLPYASSAYGVSCQNGTKTMSQRCGAALSARIVPERPRRATFPPAARNNYWPNARANICPALRRLQLAAPTETSRVSRETKAGGALRGDGGRRVKWGLKRHQQSRAPNNRMHPTLNHMLPVKLAQYPQEGGPRRKGHRSATLGRRQDSVASH